MLSVVTVLGRTGPKSDDETRIIEVRRAYNEDKRTPTVDMIKVVLWSRNKSAPFYRVEAGNLVALKGRLEVVNGELIVVAEQVNFV